MTKEQEVLSSLTDEQFQVVVDNICPGCKYKLIDTYTVSSFGEGYWHHELPGTGFKMDCRANDIRCMRGQTKPGKIV